MAMPPRRGTRTRLRRVGKMVRDLRSAAGKTSEEAAARLKCSQPKISRMENGEVGMKLAELEALLGYYQATDQQRHQILRAWEESRQKSLWSRYADALTEKFRSFVELEADARLIQAVDILLVPGLLQTERYTRALHAAAKHFPTSISANRAVEARKVRQQRLTNDNPVQLHTIVDESALRRVVGGREVMREQLYKLLDLGKRSNIVIQILPFGAGAYATMHGAFTILSFTDPEDPTTVYREHLGGGSWVEDQAEVHQYTRTFEDLRDAALGAPESADLIRRIAADLDAE
ncbi:helix-turn-helix domain-containing protein [Goodfellowiella coeruleoviolacea]|nr:helix-turn-helix transcriptional regulator [Goodfellowiella coeruleoviolacea]